MSKPQKLSSIYSKIPSFFPSSSQYASDRTWTLLAAAAVLAFGAMTEERLQELVLILLNESNEVLRKQEVFNTVDEESTRSSHLLAVRKLREGLLKSGPIIGFPRSINALRYLQTFLDLRAPGLGSILKADTSLRAAVPLSERHSRGRAFFDSIYEKHSDNVLKNLNESSGGELGEFAINCLYGDLIAEMSILGSKETAMLQFVCCLSLGSECGPQAKGHMYGARNLGNNGEEIRAAIETVSFLSSHLNVIWAKEDMRFLEIANQW